MAAPTVVTLSGQLLSVDLLTRDFEGFRSDALELADTVAPDWTDRSELDLGVTIIEGTAFMSDNLAYYQDRVGNECLWPSIQQRRSIIEQSKMIDYTLSPAVSASVEMTFVVDAAGFIPEGTPIDVDTKDGSDPATFELESDFAPAVPGTFTGIIALHGTTVSETLGSSTGQAGQSFQLAQSPLSLSPSGQSSLQVFVAEGGPAELWTEVPNFLTAQPTDKVYRVEIDENDIVTVFFSDGVNGKVPDGGTNNITTTYRVGGGRSGNTVGPDKLTKLGGTFTFVTSVTNPAQPSGGLDKESIETAKEQAPASISANDRAVTHPDYQFHARNVPGVSKAFAANGVGRYEEVIAIASAGSNPVPTGTWDPFTEVGTGLIGAVGTSLTAKKTTPVIIQVVPARVVELHLAMTVHLFKTVRRSDATRLITDAVNTTYTPDNIDFAQVLPLSLVSDVVEDITGVDYVDVDRHQREPSARALGDFLADPTFTNFLLGADTPRDRWTLQFFNASQFTVTGVDSGLQNNTGTLGSVYATDDGAFSFLASPGTIAPTSFETFEVISSPFVGNVFLDPDEVAALANLLFGLTLVGGVG